MMQSLPIDWYLCGKPLDIVWVSELCFGLYFLSSRDILCYDHFSLSLSSVGIMAEGIYQVHKVVLNGLLAWSKTLESIAVRSRPITLTNISICFRRMTTFSIHQGVYCLQSNHCIDHSRHHRVHRLYSSIVGMVCLHHSTWSSITTRNVFEGLGISIIITHFG